MSKKIFAILMAAAMMLTCLAGCGNAKTDAPAVIKIGGIGPLTGGAATYGIATKQGAEIAVAEINAKVRAACEKMEIPEEIDGAEDEFELDDDFDIRTLKEEDDEISAE